MNYPPILLESHTILPANGCLIGANLMPKKPPTSRRVSKKEVKAFLADPQWTRDDEMEHRFPSPISQKYQNPQGQLLVVMGTGNGCLHFSREQHLRILNEMPRKSFSVLKGRMPQGQTFIGEVIPLIEQLPTLLKIAPEKVDFSDDSLNRLTMAMRRVGFAKCIEAPVFPALVAYLGEMMRLRLRGEWRMRLNEDEETWEPWVVANDRAYNPWGWLYNDLEEGRGVSLSSIFHDRLQQPGVNPPGLGVTRRPALPGTEVRLFIRGEDGQIGE